MQIEVEVLDWREKLGFEEDQEITLVDLMQVIVEEKAQVMLLEGGARWGGLIGLDALKQAAIKDLGLEI